MTISQSARDEHRQQQKEAEEQSKKAKSSRSRQPSGDDELVAGAPGRSVSNYDDDGHYIDEDYEEDRAEERRQQSGQAERNKQERVKLGLPATAGGSHVVHVSEKLAEQHRQQGAEILKNAAPGSDAYKLGQQLANSKAGTKITFDSQQALDEHNRVVTEVIRQQQLEQDRRTLEFGDKINSAMQKAFDANLAVINSLPNAELLTDAEKKHAAEALTSRDPSLLQALTTRLSDIGTNLIQHDDDSISLKSPLYRKRTQAEIRAYNREQRKKQREAQIKEGKGFTGKGDSHLVPGQVGTKTQDYIIDELPDTISAELAPGEFIEIPRSSQYDLYQHGVGLHRDEELGSGLYRSINQDYRPGFSGLSRTIAVNPETGEPVIDFRPQTYGRGFDPHSTLLFSEEIPGELQFELDPESGGVFLQQATANLDLGPGLHRGLVDRPTFFVREDGSIGIGDSANRGVGTIDSETMKELGFNPFSVDPETYFQYLQRQGRIDPDLRYVRGSDLYNFQARDRKGVLGVSGINRVPVLGDIVQATPLGGLLQAVPEAEVLGLHIDRDTPGIGKLGLEFDVNPRFEHVTDLGRDIVQIAGGIGAFPHHIMTGTPRGEQPLGAWGIPVDPASAQADRFFQAWVGDPDAQYEDVRLAPGHHNLGWAVPALAEAALPFTWPYQIARHPIRTASYLARLPQNLARGTAGLARTAATPITGTASKISGFFPHRFGDAYHADEFLSAKQYADWYRAYQGGTPTSWQFNPTGAWDNPGQGFPLGPWDEAQQMQLKSVHMEPHAGAYTDANVLFDYQGGGLPGLSHITESPGAARFDAARYGSEVLQLQDQLHSIGRSDLARALSQVPVSVAQRYRVTRGALRDDQPITAQAQEAVESAERIITASQRAQQAESAVRYNQAVQNTRNAIDSRRSQHTSDTAALNQRLSSGAITNRQYATQLAQLESRYNNDIQRLQTQHAEAVRLQQESSRLQQQQDATQRQQQQQESTQRQQQQQDATQRQQQQQQQTQRQRQTQQAVQDFRIDQRSALRRRLPRQVDAAARLDVTSRLDVDQSATQRQQQDATQRQRQRQTQQQRQQQQNQRMQESQFRRVEMEQPTIRDDEDYRDEGEVVRLRPQMPSAPSQRIVAGAPVPVSGCWDVRPAQAGGFELFIKGPGGVQVLGVYESRGDATDAGRTDAMGYPPCKGEQEEQVEDDMPFMSQSISL